MNDIAKQSIADKLIKAQELEKLKRNDAGRLLGILPVYLSMMCNQKNWSHCPAKAWEVALAWVNSGDTLRQYGRNNHPAESIEVKSVKNVQEEKTHEQEESSPGQKPEGEKVSKGVKIVLQKAMIEKLDKEVGELINEYAGLYKYAKDLELRIRELEKASKPTGILTLPERHSIVIFQRNIYKR